MHKRVKQPSLHASPRGRAAAEIARLLQSALAQHRDGQLAEAESSYRELLTEAPDHVEAWYRLGAIAYHGRQHEAAVQLCSRALQLEPQSAPACATLANALYELGRYAEALVAYEHLLALQPGDAGTLHNRGLTLFHLGRHGEAVQSFDAALALAPHSAEVLNNRGMALQRLGLPDEALTSFDRALALKPDYVEALCNRGMALRRLGRYDEALACYDRALAIRPDYAEALNNRGNVLIGLKRFEEAVASLDRALALNPDFVEAFYNRGTALFDLRRYEAAVASYDAALAQRPRHAEALCNRGLALHRLKRPTAAIASYRESLAIKPDYAEAQVNLGVALREEGMIEPAIAAFEAALALAPDLAEAHVNLGNVLKEAGRLSEAERHIARAIALAPGRAGYYFDLLECRPVRAGDPHLPALETLAQNLAALSEAEQLCVHFALAKAYEDLGQHERGFAHLRAGNRLQRQGLTYDEGETLGAMQRIAPVFSPALMRAKQGFGAPSAVPIFIVGMPRSGSTLVEQILASHPAVFGAGERNDFAHAVARLPSGDGPARYPDSVVRLSGAELHALGETYLRGITPLAPAAARITDKMLSNFRLVGLIHLALPNARIIHVRRDPIDTCLSCFARLFAAPLPYAYDLGELGRYYRAYAALMAHWRALLPTGVMLEVEYEAVVADIETEARRMLAHCGLPWDPACLAFHRNRRPVRTASLVQVRQPIYAGSVGRARAYGEQLLPLREALGYTS